MSDLDDFRFKAHELLVRLDAETTKMMMMVVLKNVAGKEWDDAARKHLYAFEAWTSLMSASNSKANDQG